MWHPATLRGKSVLFTWAETPLSWVHLLIGHLQTLDSVSLVKTAFKKELMYGSILGLYCLPNKL